MKNQAASEANAKLQAQSGTDLTMHAERMPNGALYYSRPVTDYADLGFPLVNVLATRLVSFNGGDLTRRELLKYLKDARKHGLV